MTLKERYEGCLAYWQEQNPNPGTELNYSNNFELLVAVMLSAQCTDKRINMVTPALFAAYPTAEAMAKASFDDIFPLVKSVSYPNSKAQHLLDMSRMLVNEFGGEIPNTMAEMTRLPGVGRKTANVMLGQAFGKAAIAVDTHVFRVANRIGLSNGKTPLEVKSRFQNTFQKTNNGRRTTGFCYTAAMCAKPKSPTASTAPSNHSAKPTPKSNTIQWKISGYRLCIVAEL